MTDLNDSRTGQQARDTWTVVVVYENNATQRRAVEFCNYLTDQYWAEVEFDFTWQALTELRSPLIGEEVGHKAMRADMIVFALGVDGDFSAEAKAWIESFLSRRGDVEGAIVGLFEPSAGTAKGCLKEIYLRRMAHGGGMDYLYHTPPASVKALPDSLDSYNERAGQVTSVLDEILQNQPAPHPLADGSRFFPS